MRKYTLTILLVVAALVTVAIVVGSFGKDAVAHESGASPKDSIITLDMLHIQESRPDEGAVSAAPKDSIITLDKLHALENGAGQQSVGAAPKDSIITLDKLHALESGATLEEAAVP